MNEKIFTLEEFVLTFCPTAYVRVESGYNGKLLARNYRPGKNIELDNRIVCSVAPWIGVSEDHQFSAGYLRIYVDGDIELQKEQEAKATRSLSYLKDRREEGELVR